MSLSIPLNPNLKNLPVYQPGRPMEEVARELGLKLDSIIKLASNENALGPSPRAVAAMEEAIRRVHLYPDGSAYRLKNRLAESLDLTPCHLILGNGSNEIIEFLGHALMEPGTNIVVSEYCFAIYPIVARMFGAEVITVPARQFAHDIPAMASAINEKTRAVFVANPNNPTGTLADRGDLVKLVNQVPASVLLVIDEAYFEYLDHPVDFLPLLRDSLNPNLLLMRTFSKIHGLAGLRIGYGIGTPELIAGLEKIRQPFNINSVAQAAALAALDDEQHLMNTRQMNQDGLAFYELEFRKSGINHVKSHANFVLVQVGDGKRVFEELQQRGIIARPMAGYGLPEWIRITIGTPVENQRCLAALKEILAQKH